METVAAPSTARVALKWGGITGLALVIYHLILYVTQLDTVAFLSILSFAIPIIGLIWGMKEFRALNGGAMRYGQGLSLGLLMSAIIGPLIGFFDAIYKHYIDNSVMKREIDSMVERLDRSSFFTPEMIDKMVEEAGRTSPVQTFISNIFAYLIFGFLLSLIIAAFVKKDRDIFDV